MESSPSRLAQGYLVDSDHDSPAILQVCPDMLPVCIDVHVTEQSTEQTSLTTR